MFTDAMRLIRWIKNVDMKRVLLMALCCITIVEMTDMTTSYARTKEEILEQAKKEYGLVWSEHLNVDGKEVLVVAGDIDSDVHLKTIFFYMLSEDKQDWFYRLHIYARTSEVSVNYNKNNKEINLYSKKGTKLLSIPTEGMFLGIDPKEQVNPFETTE